MEKSKSMNQLELLPAGESHSKMKIESAAACTATSTTSIHEFISNGSKSNSVSVGGYRESWIFAE